MLGKSSSNIATKARKYCDEGANVTHNGYERDGVTPTYGGYSDKIVVDGHSECRRLSSSNGPAAVCDFEF